MRPMPFCIVLTTLCFPIFSAADASAGETPATELVRRLGDPSFEVRERAAEDLRKAGRAAVAALRQGLQDMDAEVRRRCAELLPMAQRTDLDVRLDDFLTDDADKLTPLPGWVRFKKLAGADRQARLLYASIYRADAALLEMLEKDANLVGAQLGDRCKRVLGPTNGKRPGEGAGPSDGELGGLLLAAACQSGDGDKANQFYNSLYQPALRSLTRGNPAARRLLAPYLAKQLNEPWKVGNSVWIARNLGLSEFIEDTLKPEARRMATAAAAKPDDANLICQAASLASNLGMQDALAGTLRPAALKLAAAVADKPDDYSKFWQTYSTLQMLRMQETIDGTLKPAVCKLIGDVAAKPDDSNKFWQALNLARALQLKEPVEQVLKPAAVKQLIVLSQQLADQNKMHQAINLVQSFDLKDASEDFLKPAARRLAAAAAAQPADLQKFQQAVHLVTTLAMKDAADAVLQPAVRKMAATATSDLNQLHQTHSFAQSLGMKETIDELLKPQVRKALLAGVNQPVNQGTIQQAINLARILAPKEGVPLAVKAAVTKDVNAWTKGQALLFVAEFGGKENIAQLEPALTDGGSLGQMGFNFATINTEVRDVALAATIALSGQSLDDYDFPYLKLFGGAARPLAQSSANCFGFSDAAGRDAAFKKWKASTLKK